MKPGDLVQIRQLDVVPAFHKAEPPIAPGRRDVWIYAHVISLVMSAPAGADEASAATGVLVQVAHPGNREHGRQLTVPLADTRTQADVLALAATATHPKFKRHFLNQAARLSPKAKPASPAGGPAKASAAS